MSSLVTPVWKVATLPLSVSMEVKKQIGNECLGSLAERLLTLVGVIVLLVSIPFLLLAGIYDMIANAICGPKGSVSHSFKETFEVLYGAIFSVSLPALIFAVSPRFTCMGEFNNNWMAMYHTIHPECLRT